MRQLIPSAPLLPGSIGIYRVATALAAALAAALLGGWATRKADVPTTLIIWPKVAGSATGATMELAIDGKTVGKLSNLSKQEALSMGDLSVGMHQFVLSSITGYGIDQAGNAQQVNNGQGKCTGQFVVQAYQNYYLVAVGSNNGTDFQCRIQ